jgi:hypothetical protein
MGIPLSRIHEITKIDMWFLKQYEELYPLEREISNYKVDTLPKELLTRSQTKRLCGQTNCSHDGLFGKSRYINCVKRKHQSCVTNW